jgi:hypothetical protein
MTEAAKTALIRKARDTKPDTALQLWLYIKAFCKVTLPYTPCCKGHKTPFHMVWYLFKNIYPEFAALGSRSSFKTLGFAISELLDLHFGQSGIVHIGAIDKQSQRCYAYVKNFLIPAYADCVDGEPLAIRTTMKNGNKLEILPCTMNQVNGPHESKVRFDEVELANPIAYNDAKGIPVSNYKTGEPPSICYTSTRKFVGGLFSQEMKRLKSQGKPVMTFCYKDVSEHCPDSRSGVIPVTIYVNRDTFKWSLRQETEEQRPFQVFDGCLKCPLVPTCLSDLKRANGVTPIVDSILRFTSSTPDFWISQGECRQPMRKGLMVYNFEAALSAHRIDHRMFLDQEGRFDRARWLFVGGKDFNYSPDATLVAMIDRHTDHIYFIKEFEYHQKTIPTITTELIKWFTSTPYSLPEDIQADKSEPGLITTMRGAGLHMVNACEESDVEGGIDLLNYLCRPMTGGTMLHVDPEQCPRFIWEMEEGYKRKLGPDGEPTDVPDAKNNHYVDCARYIVWKWLQKYAQAYGMYGGGVPMTEFSSMQANLHTLDQLKRQRGETMDDTAMLSLLMLMNQPKGD